MKPKTVIDQLLAKAKQVMITAHESPDADAISSTLAVYHYILSNYPNIKVDVLLTQAKHIGLAGMEHVEHIKWVEDIADHVEHYDTLIFLDGHPLNRFTDKPEKLDLSKFITICLDHHPGQPEGYTYAYVDVKYAACAHLIFDILFEQKLELLDNGVAEVILLGILGDTGTFRFINSKNSETLIAAKKLIDFADISVQNLELKLSEFEKTELELLGQLIANTVTVDIEGIPPFTYSYLPISTIKDYEFGLIKGAADKYKFSFLRNISGHNWGFVVTPDSLTELGISFRSMPGLPNVRELAAKYNGGGHVLAAGGSAKLTEALKDSDQLCKQIVEDIRNTQLQLT